MSFYFCSLILTLPFLYNLVLVYTSFNFCLSSFLYFNVLFFHVAVLVLFFILYQFFFFFFNFLFQYTIFNKCRFLTCVTFCETLTIYCVTHTFEMFSVNVSGGRDVSTYCSIWDNVFFASTCDWRINNRRRQ